MGIFSWRRSDKQTAPGGRQPQLMAGQNDYVFRRSRTLTGTVSSTVVASAESRGQLKSDRLKLHDLQAHLAHVLRLFGVVVAVVAMLGYLVVNYIFSPVVAIRQAGVVANPDLQTYRQTIYAYFADHPLERFGFLLNEHDLQSYLKAQHTELSAALINRAWYGGDVNFSLAFRQPLLKWQVGDKLFYVDGQGVAFTYNAFKEPKLVVTDKSGLPADQSGVIASTRFIRFVGRLVGALGNYHKGVVMEVILPASTREVDLRLSGRAYLIKANSDRDPLQAAEDIANTLSYLDKHGIRPQYVDNRVAGKAFYK